MRSWTVIASLVLALGGGSLAHAQEGEVGSPEGPSLRIKAPESVPRGERAQVRVTTINVSGDLVVRLQRVECSRVAGPAFLEARTGGGAFGTGDTVVPHRAIRYRLCARVVRDDGSVLRAERFLTVR